MKVLSRGLRVRTLLILVMIVAVFLGVSRMALRAYQAKAYQRRALAAAEARDHCLRVAELFRSQGHLSAVAKQERIAAGLDEYRRVLERAALTGETVYASSLPKASP